MNIFRHGPHFYDVHIFDLVPTSGADTLPIKGEVIFYAYPEKIYAEVKLHCLEEFKLSSATVKWYFDAKMYENYLIDEGVFNLSELPSSLQNNPPLTRKLGLTDNEAASFGLIFTIYEGSAGIGLIAGDESIEICQCFDLGEVGSETSWMRNASPKVFTLKKGTTKSLFFRIHTDTSGEFDQMKEEAEVELSPLTETDIVVASGAKFEGYNPKMGTYEISTKGGKAFSYHYNNPNSYEIASISIRNDERKRKIYLKHFDSLRGGSLEAAVVTDEEGYSLPILVQASKNFCGEHEEPLYDPGDTAYSESYFPLILRANEKIACRSYHAFQQWGAHPLKQVSSLQAWMPYYHMSVGVTETTCVVPFRFYPGHSGIWLADLRGVSGEMWTSQPQFDNVGGHRFCHYRIGEEEHFLRYLRSKFWLTSPNIAYWGMEYITEQNEARVKFHIFEAPQTDQTRCFITMRLEFHQELCILEPATNFFLVSIDTHTQKLRYETLGYLDQNGELIEQDTTGKGFLIQGVPLTDEFPFIGMYQVKPDSHQKGNNAILVRDFSGTMNGKSIENLAVSAYAFGDGNLRMGLTMANQRAYFKRGDYLEVSMMVMPYGKVGEGVEMILKERQRYGVDSPKLTVQTGKALCHYPSRILINKDQEAVFSIQGGYNTIPVLIEGFDDYRPPILEIKRGSIWRPAQMTTDSNEGHHIYLTEDNKYGFVFLIDTDGSVLDFRVRS